MVKAIVFDMDGVIFDTESLGIDITIKAGEAVGITIKKEHAEQTLGLTGKAATDYYYSVFGADAPIEAFSALWRTMMTDWVIENGMSVKRGLKSLLQCIEEKGLKKGIATSTKRKYVDIYLELAGLTTAFDEIITGEMVATGKPAPDIFLLAAEKLGVNPIDCMGIEDSPNGLKALRSAGFVSVMVPDMIPFSSELKPYVNHVCDSLNDVCGLIQ